MSNWKQVLGQIVSYSVFVVVIVYFSTSPAYQHLAPDQAVIKLSITHTGKPKGECYRRTDEELAKLPPNMRQRVICPRERHPVSVQLGLDNKLLYQEILPPSGLRSDGVSSTYKRFVVSAGQHQLTVQLGDSGPEKGYTFSSDTRIDIQPAQVLVINFSNDNGKFDIK